MDSKWTIPTLADELLKALPNLGRLIALHLRESGEEETTLMQIGVLYQIQEHPITASNIAKKRRVSLQSASVLVQGMVEKGWIVRVPNPNDRRQFLLQITPEGLERAKVTHNEIVSYLADFLKNLSAEEVAAAQIFLPALSHILTERMAATDKTHIENQPAEQEEQTPL